MNIQLFKEWFLLYSWVLLPALGVALFLYLVILIGIAVKRFSRLDELKRETRKMYKEFKKLLIKDLGGDEK